MMLYDPHKTHLDCTYQFQLEDCLQNKAIIVFAMKLFLNGVSDFLKLSVLRALLWQVLINNQYFIVGPESSQQLDIMRYLVTKIYITEYQKG